MRTCMTIILCIDTNYRVEYLRVRYDRIINYTIMHVGYVGVLSRVFTGLYMARAVCPLSFPQGIRDGVNVVVAS